MISAVARCQKIWTNETIIADLNFKLICKEELLYKQKAQNNVTVCKILNHLAMVIRNSEAIGNTFELILLAIIQIRNIFEVFS
jgi:hypothetical protein